MMAMDYNFFNAQESGVDDGKYYINFKESKVSTTFHFDKSFFCWFFFMWYTPGRWVIVLLRINTFQGEEKNPLFSLFVELGPSIYAEN